MGGQYITALELSSAQDKDTELKKLLTSQANHSCNHHHYVCKISISDGKELYHIYVNNKNENVYAPESLRFRVFEMHHDLAHVGIARTMSLIKKIFFGLL